MILNCPQEGEIIFEWISKKGKQLNRIYHTDASEGSIPSIVTTYVVRLAKHLIKKQNVSQAIFSSTDCLLESIMLKITSYFGLELRRINIQKNAWNVVNFWTVVKLTTGWQLQIVERSQED